MGNIFNDDFQDFIRALNHNGVEYILVGGYAVILHGYNRTTGDMDIWVNPTKKNYNKIRRAFSEFGMPMFDMTEDNFLNVKKFDVFSYGVPPVSIDLMTKTKGLSFPECYEAAELHELEGLSVKVIHIADLLKAKRAVLRPKDQDDINNLSEYNVGSSSREQEE